MSDRIRTTSTRHDGPSTRVILEVPLNSNLDKVLKSFVSAVVSVGGGLQAIALALSTPQDNSAEVQKRLDEIASRISNAAEKQQEAIEQFNRSKEN